MTQTPWSVTDEEQTHRSRSQTKTSSHDDRVRPHLYSSIAPNARYSSTTSHSHVPQHMTSSPHVTHTYNHFQLLYPSSAQQHDVLNSRPPFTHLPYSLSPEWCGPSGDIRTDCASPGFPQPSEIRSPWGSLYPSPNPPPNATHVTSPSILHLSTLDSTLYPDLPDHQASGFTTSAQVNPLDEYLPPPSDYYPFASSLHNAGPSSDALDYTLEPYDGTVNPLASYPCLWTEGGVICDVMVQATRSNVNRHLHAYHGFGGSDTRQTRCHWSGCTETMQQGSIARHMVTCHLQAKVTCPMCSKKLSRQDVIAKHQRVCPAASAWR